MMGQIHADLVPNWVRAYVPDNLYPTDMPAVDPDTSDPLPISQTDLLKPFYCDDIGTFGLNYVYKKLKCAEQNPDWTKEQIKAAVESFKNTMTSNPKVVIIIGNSISGLVAAYELARAGHSYREDFGGTASCWWTHQDIC